MNVLILRTSAMGDVVHALPVLNALRRALPEARLGWVVEKVFAPILDQHPDIDALIPVRLKAWRKEPLAAQTRAEFGQLRRALRNFRADVALDLMGNHKSGVLARLSGARRIVGAARADRREPSSAVWIHEPVPVSAQHAVDRGLELLAPLGVPAEPVDFGPDKIMPNAPEAAERFLAEREGPFLLIQAGAGWVNKTYPTAMWGEAAKLLRQKTGHEIWIPMAPGEESLAREIAASSDGAARTIEAYGFPFLAAILRRASMLLGGDTGPLHLAHALGTPVLCLMGPTDPHRHGPYREPERALWRELPCSFCHKRLPGVQPCLLGLTPSLLAERAYDFLIRS